MVILRATSEIEFILSTGIVAKQQYGGELHLPVCRPLMRTLTTHTSLFYHFNTASRLTDMFLWLMTQISWL